MSHPKIWREAVRHAPNEAISRTTTVDHNVFLPWNVYAGVFTDIFKVVLLVGAHELAGLVLVFVQ